MRLAGLPDRVGLADRVGQRAHAGDALAGGPVEAEAVDLVEALVVRVGLAAEAEVDADRAEEVDSALGVGRKGAPDKWAA